jgi:hypothetical protein
MGVPKMEELFGLTTNFMTLVGIPLSEVDKKPDGSPDFHFWEPLTMFADGGRIVTNIAFRGARFRRAVDGASFIGNGTGGDCDLQFGEGGAINRVWMTWRNLERVKEFKVAKPETMSDWIRKGHARQGRTPADAPEINWSADNSLIVLNAKVCYYAGNREKPSDRLVPFAALWVSVDTGGRIIELEIECPVIEETTPAGSR